MSEWKEYKLKTVPSTGSGTTTGSGTDPVVGSLSLSKRETTVTATDTTPTNNTNKP